MTRNEPVNGTARWNAIATAQMPSAIDSHSGNDSSERDQQTSRPPDGAEAVDELLGDAREQPRKLRRQHCSSRVQLAASALGLPASTKSTTSSAEGADRRRQRRPTSPPRTPRDSPRRGRGRRRRHRAASSTSTVNMSSTRSRMTVANAPVALIRSWRDRKYGRMTSPARAGSIAARRKPDRRGAKRIGKARPAERLEQVLPSPRPDRQIHEHRRQRQRQPLGLRVHDLAATPRRSTLYRNSASSATASAQDDERYEHAIASNGTETLSTIPL